MVTIVNGAHIIKPVVKMVLNQEQDAQIWERLIQAGHTGEKLTEKSYEIKEQLASNTGQTLFKSAGNS